MPVLPSPKFLAQVAVTLLLAWLLTRGDHVVPIPGVKRRVTLEDSVAAAELELSAADIAAIEAAGLGHGWREPEVGVGRSYEFEDPDGHLMALYYDTEKYVPDDLDRPALKNP